MLGELYTYIGGYGLQEDSKTDRYLDMITTITDAINSVENSMPNKAREPQAFREKLAKALSGLEFVIRSGNDKKELVTVFKVFSHAFIPVRPVDIDPPRAYVHTFDVKVNLELGEDILSSFIVGRCRLILDRNGGFRTIREWCLMPPVLTEDLRIAAKMIVVINKFFESLDAESERRYADFAGNIPERPGYYPKLVCRDVTPFGAVFALAMYVDHGPTELTIALSRYRYVYGGEKEIDSMVLDGDFYIFQVLFYFALKSRRLHTIPNWSEFQKTLRITGKTDLHLLTSDGWISYGFEAQERTVERGIITEVSIVLNTILSSKRIENVRVCTLSDSRATVMVLPFTPVKKMEQIIEAMEMIVNDINILNPYYESVCKLAGNLIVNKFRIEGTVPELAQPNNNFRIFKLPPVREQSSSSSNSTQAASVQRLEAILSQLDALRLMVEKEIELAKKDSIDKPLIGQEMECPREVPICCSLCQKKPPKYVGKCGGKKGFFCSQKCSNKYWVNEEKKEEESGI